MATGQTIVGELLCEAVELHAREPVLDLATGSGNTALAASRRRGRVVGIDFVPELLRHGRRRADAERLAVDFLHGSVETLPFPDATFSCVLSTFGVMFAREPERAAAEMVRVTRPGGRIGLASWTPDGFVGELFAVTGRRGAGVASLEHATRWGTEAGLRALFAPHPYGLTFELRSVVMRADSPEAYVGFFRRFFGPTIAAFEGLDAVGQAALERDLLDVVRRHNLARDGTTFVPATYLEAVLRRPEGAAEPG